MVLEHFETQRLRFRSLLPSDKRSLHEFFNDKIATEFLFIQDPLPEYIDSWIARQDYRYAIQGCGLCAVELKETGEVIGQCGIIQQWVDSVPKLEISYHFIRRFWGNGYATEAAMGCRDFAFQEGLAETLISIIHPDNRRSKAVAERNGMTLWKETEHKGHRSEVFRIRWEDWIVEQLEYSETEEMAVGY